MDDVVNVHGMYTVLKEIGDGKMSLTQIATKKSSSGWSRASSIAEK